MYEVIIPSLATVVSAAVAGWFALEKSKDNKNREEEKKQREEEREEQMHQNNIQRRSAELTKCIALNMINPDAHICDIKDALVKLDAACEAYDEFLEKIRIAHIH